MYLFRREVKLMPSEQVLEKKKQQVNELSSKLSTAVSGVLVDYKGINVQEDTQLRSELRAAGVDYFVAKNTLLKRAAEAIGLSGLEGILEGTTSVAVSNDNYVAPARVIAKHAGQLGDRFNIKAGFADGKILDAEMVQRLANLPGEQELVAMVLRGLIAPISGLVNVLNANIRGLAVVIGAIVAQKAG
ncbi:MAG: 50S ribosomal protein L10 [Oscillospiraceae bacterium]|nr:50S ribosomal protein L10 [Oscillospiraceae bacterium]